MLANFTDLEARIALSMIPGLTVPIIRKFAEVGLEPREFFTISFNQLRQVLHLNSRIEPYVVSPEIQEAVKREVMYIQRHPVRPLFITDPDYPYRLQQCADAPAMIYVVGNADLMADRALAFVGTRTPTPYGVKMCHDMVADFAKESPGLLVVSGLAYGIDATAHKAALENGLPTVAVVAHGLDTIYPAQHRGLATEIIRAGGAIVTEFPSGTRPLRQRFLQRNRIIAGLTDGTVVVESDIKGGALSTARHALDYDREVMAIPGRATDQYSSGCNHLIYKQRAGLVNSTKEIMDTMNWEHKVQEEPVQPTLFPEIEERFKPVLELLKDGKVLSLDEIHAHMGGKVHILNALLAEMEFAELIAHLPGNRYSAL